MEFEASVLIWVDPKADFLEAHGDHCFSVEQMIKDVLYDVDDIEVKDCEVNRYDNE
jgi:hypothetical protein